MSVINWIYVGWLIFWGFCLTIVSIPIMWGLKQPVPDWVVGGPNEKANRELPQHTALQETSKSSGRYTWAGDGPVPASWVAEDGTKVYRSYEDYCDD